MLSSVLDPSKIVNQRKSSPESFQKFMSGEGSPLGSSMISSAANKIVGFSKVGVSPVTPDISSILNDISTSIISNVDNSIKNTTNFVINDVDRKIGALRSEIYDRLVDIESSIGDLQSQTYSAIRNVQESALSVPSVQSTTPVSDIPKVIENIQVQVQETLNTTLSNFSKDYQKKIKGIDDVKPKNVLDKFLDLYRNAIGFINFFSDRKNINRLTENLKSIRGIFDTTFNVAKILRETILKIVKQLTNLPSASASSPGLDLNVNIPGGGLKQAAGPQVSRVGKVLKMGALGLGAVGLGVAGAEAAKRYQESQLYAQAEPDQSGMPGNFIEMFSSIVDKFSNVIENLINGTKSSQDTTPSGGGGGISPSSSPGSSSSPGGGAVASGSADEKIAAYTSVLEGTGGQNAADAFQVMLNRAAQNHSGYGGLGEQVMASGQFTPIAAAIYGTSGDNAANRAYGHIAPMLGKTPEERKAKIRQIVETEGMQGLDRIFNKNLAGNANVVLGDFKSGGPLSQAAVQGVKGREYFKGQSDLANKRPEDFYRGTGGNYFHGNTSGKIGYLEPSTATAPTPTKPGVAAAPAEIQMTETRAQAISQPAQQVPTTVSLPPTIIDASSPQQQSSGSRSPTPQSGGGGGIEVPFLPTSNPNNFYVLYARSVYNVVDG